MSLFSKKDILLIILSFARTFKTSLRAFFQYFFWLALLIILSRANILGLHFFAGAFFADLLSALFIFFYVLCVRPVVDLRNVAYFYQNSKKLLNFIVFYFAYFWITIFLVSFFGAIITLPFASFHNVVYVNNFIVNLAVFIGLILNKILFVSVVFYLLFTLDDVKSVHPILFHLKKSFRLLILFLPIILVFSIAISGLYFLNQYLCMINKILGSSFSILLDMIFICMLSVFFLRVKNRIF